MTNAVGEDRSDFQAGGQSWSASDFGFSKATEGLSWQSKTFGGNWARLKAQGKRRGAYHFFHPAEPAAAQAQFFVNYVTVQRRVRAGGHVRLRCRDQRGGAGRRRSRSTARTGCTRRC